MTETYDFILGCDNCHSSITVEIPIGTSTRNYFNENKLCPICECDIRR